MFPPFMHPLLRSTSTLVNFHSLRRLRVDEIADPPVNLGGPVDSTLDSIASSMSAAMGTKVEPSQVLLRLAAQHGAIVVTTSGKDWRMKEQLAAGALPALSVAELKAIEETGKLKYARVYMPHMEL